jgi:hypothetical protein
MKITKSSLHKYAALLLVSSLVLLFNTILPGATFAEEKIDASDPTKIYSYAGAGIKYTDYTNDESMWEIRATGNLGLSASDMVMFELGYGWHNGDLVAGDNNDLTNARLRWFHLFKMDNSVTSGYRGLATQIDLQVAGGLKGTDGQNTLVFGALPAFAINEQWSFYLAINAVNTWDKEFKNYNGFGIGAAPLLVFVPEKWWPGAYLQIWPNYTAFVSGELSGDGSGSFDVTTGGTITQTVLWSVTGQKNIDKDLRAFRRGKDAGLKNDWNLFFSITTYF